MKKKILSTLLAGAMVLSMAACGNSADNTANNSSTTGSSSQGTTSSDAGQASDTQTDSFTYPMDAITLTVNGTVDGGTDYYDDSQHPAWAKDLYYHKVIKEKTALPYRT